MESWCELWNIEVNEDKTQTIYFCRRPRPVEAHLTLTRRNIPFINHAKDLGVVSDKNCVQNAHMNDSYQALQNMYSCLPTFRKWAIKH